MRRHPHRAQLVDEVICIISLVGSKRDRMRPVGARLDHVQRRHPLGMPAGLGQAGIDQQAMAVFHQPVVHKAELGLLALGFTVKPGVRVGRRGMRLVGALLAMKVRFSIPTAAAGRRRTGTILRLDTLH